MAKAHLQLADGTTVNIEGTADEVATLLARFSGSTIAPPVPAATKPARAGKTGKSRATDRRKGPKPLIEELIEQNYFKAKRTIGDIQKKLEEKGHIYAMHSLSTPLLRLTRSRALRRIKEKNGWVYVS
jgi:hypothetical protein